MSTQEAQAARRRTFAIISHPDAGKTTLTEKLLLYSGAIHLAGSVKARKASRHAVSDWMQMEQERGISITSSVLQFEHRGHALNLLDTPGHADFSEDTYRTLAAVDSAVMLIDHAKGVEARTLRLFEVCRMRQLPVITFMNKLDRYGRDPLDLLDDVSKALDLRVTPLNWPIGQGREFLGVVDVATRKVRLFDPEARQDQPVAFEELSFEQAKDRLSPTVFEKLEGDLDLLAEAGTPWDEAAYLRGDLSPVFFGSAMTNFGVEPLLEFLSDRAAPPGPRKTEGGELMSPSDPRFSGFIFKIQANMNPRHRDRIAFLRVVSGRFFRGMDVVIGRSGETLRLSKPHSFLAQERSIVEEAWPGDVVGLYDPGKLRIGDTLGDLAMRFTGIPRFAPEFFVQITIDDPMKRKSLDAGLEQLSHEGVIQLFFRPGAGRLDPFLGAVGQLQFEVLKERLKSEYRVPVSFLSTPYRFARWVRGKPEGLRWLQARRDYAVTEDRNGSPVLLTETKFSIDYALEHAPGLELHDIEPL